MFQTKSYEDPIVLPPATLARWDFLETNSAAAVLRSVCSSEWEDICAVLQEFSLDPCTWLRSGGNRGAVAKTIDDMFGARGWRELRVDLETRGILLDKRSQVVGELPVVKQEGYLVDNFKGRVALDVEWNAKDGNLDRDLAAYRSWYEAGVISGAVLITQNRLSLKALADRLWRDWLGSLPDDHPGKRAKLPIDLNTSTTTNLDKVDLRVKRGVMGTCPLLVVAAKEATWNGAPYTPPPQDAGPAPEVEVDED